jgi:hypothetical protein
MSNWECIQHEIDHLHMVSEAKEFAKDWDYDSDEYAVMFFMLGHLNDMLMRARRKSSSPY